MGKAQILEVSAGHLTQPYALAFWWGQGRPNTYLQSLGPWGQDAQVVSAMVPWMQKFSVSVSFDHAQPRLEDPEHPGGVEYEEVRECSPHLGPCYPLLLVSQRCLGGRVPFLGGTSGLTDGSLCVFLHTLSSATAHFCIHNCRDERTLERQKPDISASGPPPTGNRSPVLHNQQKAIKSAPGLPNCFQEL